MNILITGASNGIGYQTALLLSEKGNTVFAIARNKKNLDKLKEESLKRNPDSKLHVIAGDITNEDFLSSLAKEISSHAKSIDILINNAGTLINKPFEELSSKDWNDVYSTNVFAPVNIIKALLPLLSVSKSSHILNISSMGGFQGSAKFKGLSAYSSSKAALVGVTECLAEEFKDKNISVNCLCLGSAETEMFRQAFPGAKAASTVEDMAAFIAQFAKEGQKLFNGKVLPVASSTP